MSQTRTLRVGRSGGARRLAASRSPLHRRRKRITEKMPATRIALYRLRSLFRRSTTRPPPASSFPPYSPGCGICSPTATPSGSHHRQHEWYQPNKLPALLTVGSFTVARSLRQKQREQRAGEFCTRACRPREEQEGALDSSPFGPCFSVCIRCCKRDADALSEALLCFGASSSSMDELTDFDDTAEILVTSIFIDGQDVDMCISNAAKSIGLMKTPKYEVTVTEQFNWMHSVQESFHPLQVTDGLWVVPEWRTPPDIQATNIILNPGMAFGTGEHPTTQLCLLLLHGSIKGGESFLDYGTGSGVLGIAAIKMGAALSVGIDTDPQALSSARQNIALNEIEPGRMLLYLSPGKDSIENKTHMDEFHARKEKFDIIVANILLNPLLELAEELVSYAKPGAVVGVSGIICEQIPEVEGRYSKYLESISISKMDGWACLAGNKRL